MKTVSNLAIAIGLLALPAGGMLAQSGNDLFQQALVKERSEGNFAEAIKLYQTIVQKYGSDRKLAAKALFQMGQAYEKLGNSEARKAYERIARDFGDQKDIAADANRRLAALSIPPNSDKSRTRLVLGSEGFGKNSYPSVSPDGRWVAMDDWTTADGDLVIRELATGQIKRLDLGTCGANSKHCAFAENAVFSPDNRQIAYTWYDDLVNNATEHLRIIANEVGAKPRMLLTNIGLRAWPVGWSPDAKSLYVLVRHEDDSTWQIGRVALSDGSLTILKSLGWRIPRGAAPNANISPDGRYIAYSALAINPSKAPPARPESTDRHIYLRATDGSAETELVKTAAISLMPLWTEDGAHIVYTSDLSGKADLWSIAVHDGKAAGSPRLLMRDLGDGQAAGITRSGSYYYTLEKNGVEQVSVAELSSGGKNRILETFVGINPTWSPDGSSLAFSRHSTRGDNNDLIVRSVRTGEEKVYSHEGLRVAPPRWLHDGKGFIQYLLTPGASLAASVVDLKTGEFKQLFSGANLTGVSAFSQDDKILYFASRDPNTKSTNILDRILAVDLASVTERQVIVLPNTASIGFALSPDGRMLAISRLDNKTWEAHLGLAGIDGSNYREIGGPFKSSGPYDKVAWSKDGRSILFASNDGDGNGDWHIMRLGIERGKAELTGLNVKALSTFDLSPDGSRLAFSTLASGNKTSELFAIDNLNSLLRDSQ